MSLGVNKKTARYYSFGRMSQKGLRRSQTFPAVWRLQILRTKGGPTSPRDELERRRFLSNLG